MSLLFVLWFSSGIVMMYVGFPELTPAEHLAGLQPISYARLSTTIRVENLNSAYPLRRLRLNTVLDRPAFHMLDSTGKWRTVFADDGSFLTHLNSDQALRSGLKYLPTTAAPDQAIVQSDQWTVSGRLDAYRPLHHLSMNDDNATELYLSSRTGELVQATTRTERAWNWVGAIIHWIYPFPLRQNRELWRQCIIGLAAGGCLTALTGMIHGLQRYRFTSRFRHGDSKTPYRGIMRWHHISGLVVGIMLIGWVFSGLLSVNPGSFFPETSASESDLAAVEGKPINLEAVLAVLPKAFLLAKNHVRPIEVEFTQVDGKTYAIFYETPSKSITISLNEIPMQGFVRFENRFLEQIAAKIGDIRQIVETGLLPDGDWYYYRHHQEPRLPVYRMKLNDREQTWLYLDPHSGRIVQKLTRSGRVYRWLFNALHSWDYPLLIQHRPLWDIVIIVMALVGLLVSLTGVVISYRRLKYTYKAF